MTDKNRRKKTSAAGYRVPVKAESFHRKAHARNPAASITIPANSQVTAFAPPVFCPPMISFNLITDSAPAARPRLPDNCDPKQLSALAFYRAPTDRAAAFLDFFIKTFWYCQFESVRVIVR
jgi:hypothetical protein